MIWSLCCLACDHRAPLPFEAPANKGILPFPQNAEQMSTNSPTESVIAMLPQKSSSATVAEFLRNRAKENSCQYKCQATLLVVVV